MYSQIMMLASGVTTSIDRSVPLAERLGLGLKTLVLGMGIVLFILALLWGILELFKVVFYDLPNKRGNKTPAVSETESIPAAEPLEIAADETSDDEIIAVITAAISVYREIEPEPDIEYTGGFRVISFKKIKTAPTVRRN